MNTEIEKTTDEKIRLRIDGDAECTLQEFIACNSEPSIDDSDISTIRDLKVGKVHAIPVHAGWCVVKRIA